MIDGLFSLLFELLGDLITNFFDLFINLLSLLPGSPFAHALEAVADFEYLGYMNYFIPFKGMQVVMNIWIAALSAFYIYRYIKKYTDYIQRFTHIIKG